jgi:hypothetical protein
MIAAIESLFIVAFAQQTDFADSGKLRVSPFRELLSSSPNGNPDNPVTQFVQENEHTVTVTRRTKA